MQLTLALSAALAVCAAGLRTSFKLPVGGKVNQYAFGDPTTGCMAGEQNVTVEGVSGDFCSPACDASGGCPTNIEPGIAPSTAGQCVLVAPGNTDPTLCALLCTPGTAKACGVNSTCQPIQGLGLCTYVIGA